jgi:hypothetical protein
LGTLLLSFLDILVNNLFIKIDGSCITFRPLFQLRFKPVLQPTEKISNVYD